jgi:hypothetical protein
METYKSNSQDLSNGVKIRLDLIFDQLSNGWLYYFCAKSLYEAFQKQRITGAYFFFIGTLRACLNESILSLSKLLEQKESVSIFYLLNYVENKVSEFQGADPNVIKKEIHEHRIKLKKYENLYAKIKTQRDKILAHLDKILLNKQSVTSTIPYIDMNEVEDCFREMFRIISEYSKFYDGSEYSSTIYEDNVPRDLEFLLSLINPGSQ